MEVWLYNSIRLVVLFGFIIFIVWVILLIWWFEFMFCFLKIVGGEFCNFYYRIVDELKFCNI